MGFHVPLDTSLGMARDVWEVVVRDKLIFIISIHRKRPSHRKTPTFKLPGIWNIGLPTWAHREMQEEGVVN